MIAERWVWNLPHHSCNHIFLPKTCYFSKYKTFYINAQIFSLRQLRREINASYNGIDPYKNLIIMIIIIAIILMPSFIDIDSWHSREEKKAGPFWENA